MILESTRQQWDEGKRRLDTVGAEAARGRHLWLLVEAVLAELRRRRARLRVARGAELARAYEGSEDWIREVVLRSAPPKSRAGIRDVALVQDAAFAHYALGASDYRP